MDCYGVPIPNNNCKKCGYYTNAQNPFIMGEGRRDAPLVVFVGEAPGEAEDSKARPFVGKAGRLLRKAVSDAGATKDVYYTYLCMCKSDKDKITLTKAKLCADRLSAELQHVCGKDTVIVPLGANPMKAMLGKTYTKITQHKMQRIDYGGRVVIPHVSPAYIMRNPHMAKDYGVDIGRILDIAKGVKEVASQPTKPEEIGSYRLVGPEEFVQYCRAADSPISVDVECNTLKPLWLGKGTKLLSVAVSKRAGEAVCLVVEHREIARSSLAERKDAVRRALSGVPCIGHNLKFDSQVLLVTCGIDVRQSYDTMLAHHILHPVRGTHGLKVLATSELGVGDYEQPIRALNLSDYGDAPMDLLWKYNAVDADLTYRLKELYSEKMKVNAEAQKLFDELSMPMSRVYTNIERNGVGFDMIFARKMQIDYTAQAECAEALLNSDKHVKQMNLDTNKYMNFRSSQQVAKILFHPDYYGLPVLKETPSGKPSTNKDVLADIAKHYDCPFVRNLLTLRAMNKVLSTYLNPPMNGEWTGPDGRVHPNFKISGTETGRLSCSDPNLQNIPRSEIRGMFAAPEGRTLVEADFSQMELRVLAVESGDKVLTKAFLDGVDVHKQTAAKLFGISVDKVTDDQRQKAKVINFGLSYGMSSKGFAERTGVSVQDADSFIGRYFEEFPQVHDYILNTKYFVEENGFVRSMTGRVRFLPDGQNPDHYRREAAFREAVNAPIQAAASDLVQASILEVYKQLRRKPLWRAKIGLSVHDSVVVECGEKYGKDVARLLTEVMPVAAKKFLEVETKIEFPVDVSIIKRLGDK